MRRSTAYPHDDREKGNSVHILVTGGTGLIGSALTQRLKERGCRLTILSRQSLPSTPQCRYIAAFEELPLADPIDAVINLAGESLAGARWSTSFKARLRASRIDLTRHMIQVLSRLEIPPPRIISASAVGFYGAQGDLPVVEDGAIQPGFSHTLCQDWEEAARGAEAWGASVSLMRLGVVLAPSGGALQQLRLPFRFGVASWMGSGRQWFSWIHIEDVLQTCEFLLERADLAGPFNVTAPLAVTARGFADAMAARHRIWLTTPVPASLLRIGLGEMAEALLLTGQNVKPARLEQAGFSFKYPRLDEALDHLLVAPRR